MQMFTFLTLAMLSSLQIAPPASTPTRQINVDIRAVDMHGNPIPNASFALWSGEAPNEPLLECKANKEGVSHQKISIRKDADLISASFSVVGLSDQQLQDLRGAPAKVLRRIQPDINTYSLDFIAPTRVIKVTGKIDCSPINDMVSQLPVRYGDWPLTSGLNMPSPDSNGRFTVTGFVTGEFGSGYLNLIADGDIFYFWEIKPPQGTSEFDCGTLRCAPPAPSRRVRLDAGETFNHKKVREYDFLIYLLSDTGSYAVPISSLQTPIEERDVPAGTYYVVPCSFDQLGRAVEVLKSPGLKAQLDQKACPKIIVPETPGKKADAPANDNSPITHTFNLQEAWDAWDNFIVPL